MPKVCKAVFFDLDGTLIDSYNDILNAFAYSMKEAGVEVATREAIIQEMGAPLEVMAHALCPGISVEIATRIGDTYRDYYPRHFTDTTVAFDGIEQLLEELRPHVKLCVLTTKRTSMAVELVEQLGLSKYFDYVQGCDPGNQHKPSPETAQILFEKLNLEPENCVMVGDTASDVGCGKQAGMETVAVSYGFRTREHLETLKPTYLVDTVKELKKLFYKMELF